MPGGGTIPRRHADAGQLAWYGFGNDVVCPDTWACEQTAEQKACHQMKTVSQDRNVYGTGLRSLPTAKSLFCKHTGAVAA
jgi:hypothetical protein